MWQKDEMMAKGPVFVGGINRSGKTLLAALLSLHPNIAIPAVGPNMWTYFYHRFGNLSWNDNLDRCLAAMMSYTHIRRLNPDLERIHREFLQGKPTYARLFALFLSHYAEQTGKFRWGDQSNRLERYADDIFNAYPAAKIIHIIRDPRDRYEAHIAQYPRQKGKLVKSIASWLISAYLAKHNKQRHPEGYKIVRYETLVNYPEATLRDISAFLNEDYSPAMLAVDQAPGFIQKHGGVTSTYIGRFRLAMSERELALMQTCARENMTFNNYPLEEVHLSLYQWLLFYLITLPASKVYIITWVIFQLLRHKLPVQFGYTIAPKAIISN
jgi:hypothetical protein